MAKLEVCNASPATLTLALALPTQTEPNELNSQRMFCVRQTRVVLGLSGHPAAMQCIVAGHSTCRVNRRRAWPVLPATGAVLSPLRFFSCSFSFFLSFFPRSMMALYVRPAGKFDRKSWKKRCVSLRVLWGCFFVVERKIKGGRGELISRPSSVLLCSNCRAA